MEVNCNTWYQYAIINQNHETKTNENKLCVYVHLEKGGIRMHSCSAHAEQFPCDTLFKRSSDENEFEWNDEKEKKGNFKNYAFVQPKLLTQYFYTSNQ